MFYLNFGIYRYQVNVTLIFPMPIATYPGQWISSLVGGSMARSGAWRQAPSAWCDPPHPTSPTATGDSHQPNQLYFKQMNNLANEMQSISQDVKKVSKSRLQTVVVTLKNFKNNPTKLRTIKIWFLSEKLKLTH